MSAAVSVSVRKPCRRHNSRHREGDDAASAETGVRAVRTAVAEHHAAGRAK